MPIRRFQTPSLLAGSSSSRSSELPPFVLHRAQEDLRWLRMMLPRVRAFLEDAEEREILDKSVRLWVRQLRGVAYDADDVLEEFDFHLLRADPAARAEDQFSNALPQVADGCSFWGELPARVEQIRRRFEEIVYQREFLRLTGEVGERRHHPGAATASARSPSSCFVVTQCFYGREEEKKKVIDGFLLSDQCLARNLSVMPIVGMGGVGKTTLVQHVYNDQAVSEHFEMWGWVCVSDDFDPVALTTRILEALTKKSHHLSEFSTLQEALRREIQGKRFFLVLDDMWNEVQELWNRLQAPLHFGAKGSAIVTTTRSERVAAVVQTAPPLNLICLSNEECWRIFQQYAFDGRDPSCSQDLVDVGRRIVGKCGGLPLAVKALGGLLRTKPDAQSWEDILQSGLWDLDEQGDGVLSALKLSYLHLKTNLKQCFVYCSIFPKDHRFTKSQLVNMWVAQGFIQHGSGRQVEDIGSDYFEELLQRSFFQYCEGEQTSPYLWEHEETHVMMHDLIHDLAQSISEGECYRIEYGKSDSLLITEARHLSLVGSIPPCDTVAARALRTFMMLKVLFLSHDNSVLLNNMLSNMQCLRVLDLSHLPLFVLSDEVGNLIHLRYLNLSYTQISSLPESVCELHHIQTLLLTGCPRLRSLPKGIKNLTSLRNLPVFCVGRYGRECRVKELKDLVNLRGCLEIYGLDCVSNVNDAKMANLRNKTSLHELRLCWVDVPGDRLLYLRRKASPSFEDDDDDYFRDIDDDYRRKASPSFENDDDDYFRDIDADYFLDDDDDYFSGSDSSVEPVCDELEIFEKLEPPTSLRVLEIYKYNGSHFPSWMGSQSLDNLVKVELYCCSTCAVLPMLGQCPYLKHLHISDFSRVKSVGSEFRGDVEVGFPSLEVLVLEQMRRWESWLAVERGDFPRLRRLEIRHGDKLRGTLPISYPLPMLKELVLQCCGHLNSVHLYSLPSLELLHIDDCGRLKSIELLSSRAPLYSESLPVELPPLKHLEIAGYPEAHFLPKQHRVVAPLLRMPKYLRIHRDCPSLLEWCQQIQRH